MEVRYALRELERVIGEPERRLDKLDDGRDAVFMHTFLSKSVRHDFYERRDAIEEMKMSVALAAAACGNPNIKHSAARETAYNMLDVLHNMMFPYSRRDRAVKEKTQREIVADMFDELKRIKEEEMEKDAKKAEAAASVENKNP